MKRRGFSLFEMIVVLGIMSIATGIGASVFIQMGDNWKRVRRTSELETVAQTVFASIGKDAENMLAPRLTGVGVHSEMASYIDPREYASTALQDGQLSIPVYAAIGPGQSITAAKVTYRVDRSLPEPRLMRSVSPLYGEGPGGNAMVVAEGVYSFAVEYPERVEGAQPRLLRISVLLSDETRPYDQIARTAVVPLRVE